MDNDKEPNFNSQRIQIIGKKLVRKVTSVVNLAVLVIFLLLFAYGSYSLWDTDQVFQSADPIQFAAYKPQKDNTIPFDQLRQINPEVFGWLSVYGTNIDYPIVQADNNEKYVNTNSKGDYSLAGSIFLDYRNSKDFSDFNSIIYGHHMEKRVMFGEIGYFVDKEYFDIHKYGNLFVDGKDHGLEFFAYLQINASNGGIYSPGIKNPEVQQKYLNSILDKAMYKRDIDVKITDRLVILSTCTTDITNGRGILVARITDKTFPDTLKAKDDNSTNGISVDGWSLIGIWNQLPLWGWVLIYIALLLLLAKIYDKTTKRLQKRTRKEE